MLTAWDQCLLAKFKPGTINAPVVAGMNVTPFPTLIASTSGSEAKADRYLTGQLDIGTDEYVLIAFCPIATSFYGDGGVSNFPTTTKLGGVVYQQSPNISSVALWASRFENVVGGRSMAQVYGSDMQGFSSRGFVWAAEVDYEMNCPNATLAGTVYTGSILVS